MEPDIPPNFLGVIDATRFHEQVAVVRVLRKRFEGIGNASARQPFENYQPITFQSGVVSHAEWRVIRQRVNERQEIARVIHKMNGSFAIWNSHVHMQAEDE